MVQNQSTIKILLISLATIPTPWGVLARPAWLTPTGDPCFVGLNKNPHFQGVNYEVFPFEKGGDYSCLPVPMYEQTSYWTKQRAPLHALVKSLRVSGDCECKFYEDDYCDGVHAFTARHRRDDDISIDNGGHRNIRSFRCWATLPRCHVRIYDARGRVGEHINRFVQRKEEDKQAGNLSKSTNNQFTMVEKYDDEEFFFSYGRQPGQCMDISAWADEFRSYQVDNCKCTFYKRGDCDHTVDKGVALFDATNRHDDNVEKYIVGEKGTIKGVRCWEPWA